MEITLIEYKKSSALIGVILPVAVMGWILGDFLFFHDGFILRLNDYFVAFALMALGILGSIVVLWPSAINVLRYGSHKAVVRDGMIYLPTGVVIPVNEMASVEVHQRLPGTGGVVFVTQTGARHFIETLYQAKTPIVSARDLSLEFASVLTRIQSQLS